MNGHQETCNQGSRRNVIRRIAAARFHDNARNTSKSGIAGIVTSRMSPRESRQIGTFVPRNGVARAMLLRPDRHTAADPTAEDIGEAQQQREHQQDDADVQLNSRGGL